METQNSGLSGSYLTGSTYCFINYGSELIGGGAPGVYTSHVNAVLTFTSSTQVTLSNRTNVDSFLNTSTSVIDSASTSVDPIGAFSYSLNANTLTITGINDGGFSNLYHLTLDGNVLIGDNSRLDGADHGADFTIAVRANSCN